MSPYEMLDTIISFVFSIQCVLLVLVAIGAYALLWWSIDNFKSIVQVIRSMLLPYFQPQDDVALSEKFGHWAGTWRGQFFCRFRNFLVVSALVTAASAFFRIAVASSKDWRKQGMFIWKVSVESIVCR